MKPTDTGHLYDKIASWWNEQCGQNFYYSSLSEEEYLRILKDAECKLIHLERDQYPEDHVVFIAVKVRFPAG